MSQEETKAGSELSGGLGVDETDVLQAIRLTGFQGHAFDAFFRILAERDRYREALDSLKMQAVENLPTDEWMAIPKVEFEQVFRDIGWNA